MAKQQSSKEQTEKYQRWVESAKEERRIAKEERDEAIEATRQAKANNDEIDEKIKQNSARLEELDAAIEQKEPLGAEVSNLENEKETLINEVKTLGDDKDRISEEISTETEILHKLKDESGLYSKDLAGIGKKNKKLRNVYAVTSALCALIVLFFVGYLIHWLIFGDPLPDKISKLFSVSEGGNIYRFYSLILIRISFASAIFIIIFLFFGLFKGFFAQYVRSNEKMEALGILDFLVNRIESEESPDDEAQRQQYLSRITDEKIKVLNQHLPSLMESERTKFDKNPSTGELLQLLKNFGKFGGGN